MDLGIVVLIEIVLLLFRDLPHRLGDISAGILGADHEADLAGWVGRDGGVCVLDDWEDGAARLLEFGDQWKVEPLVFSYSLRKKRLSVWLAGQSWTGVKGEREAREECDFCIELGDPKLRGRAFLEKGNRRIPDPTTGSFEKRRGRKRVLLSLSLIFLERGREARSFFDLLCFCSFLGEAIYKMGILDLKPSSA